MAASRTTGKLGKPAFELFAKVSDRAGDFVKLSDDKINAGLAYFASKAANAGVDLVKLIRETTEGWFGAADNLALEGAGGLGKIGTGKVDELAPRPTVLKMEKDPLKNGKTGDGEKKKTPKKVIDETILNSFETNWEKAQYISKQMPPYEVGKCEDYAKKLATLLKKHKIEGGEILQMTVKPAVNIWSEKYKGNISTNGRHRAILLDGKVFDNLTPQGIDHEIWRKDLLIPYGEITFTKTEL